MSNLAKNGWWIALLVLAAAGTLWNTPGRSGEAAVVLPAPALDNAKSASPVQTAVLAGGCFWGVQGVYQYTKGVKKVLSGYSGGDKSTADYEKVGTGRTGHAESVQIVFDPKEI
ncbi:MAG TPA: peptide-methionine (S)-S-oxide reductase, partial [Burkholderiales bacterium]|nr:peptide-methionine (S)-S-oxide reductase [Burkholderiales bacterium]